MKNRIFVIGVLFILLIGLLLHSIDAAPFGSGSGPYGITSNQVVRALGFVPVSATGGSITNFTTYASGTAYTLTGSSAALDFGTTDPVLTINQTGTYLIMANVGLKYTAATYAGAQTVSLKLRRTNNTAADLSNGARTVELPVLTAFTGGDVMQLPGVVYTATSGDIITIFGILSATPSAGSITTDSAEVIAIRLF